MENTKNNAVTTIVFLAIMFGFSTGAQASLIFDFSFSNTLIGGTQTMVVPGTVSGRIEGLFDNSTGAASTIVIESFPALGAGSLSAPINVTLWPDLPFNSFTVSNGSIINANFVAFISVGFDSYFFSIGTGSALQLLSGELADNVLSLSTSNGPGTPTQGYAVGNFLGLNGINFSQRDVLVSAPASFGLLSAAILVLLRRRIRLQPSVR